MTILRYPIPYQIYAIPKGMRNPREIDVADEVAFEIPDCDDIDAPIIAKMHKEWPMGVFPADSYQKRNNIRPEERPDTEIRSFNGEFYAAVVIDRGVPHKFAKVEDFDSVMGGGRHFATSFSHLYSMRDEATKKRLQAQREGNLTRLEDIPHTKRDRTIEKHSAAREYVLDFASQDAKQYIAINGFLWRKLEREPKLQYEVQNAGPIKVSLEMPFTRGGKRRVFNLARMEDLIDHLATTYPEIPVSMEIFDLEVFQPDAFKFDDEAETMWTVAYELRNHMAGKIAAMPDEVAEAWYDLRDELIGTKVEDAPGKAQRFAELSTILVDHFKEDRGLETARHDLERWNMRPTCGNRLGFGG